MEEHDEALVRNWNEVVKPGDTVWHLGDVLFGVEAFKYIARLNGLKNLVLGNHDHYDIELYQQHFRKIVPYHKTHGVLLSHMPVHPSQLGDGHRYRGNIHGHLHSKSLNDPRYVNVSVECWNLRPVLLDKVVAMLPKIKEER